MLHHQCCASDWLVIDYGDFGHFSHDLSHWLKSLTSQCGNMGFPWRLLTPLSATLVGIRWWRSNVDFRWKMSCGLLTLVKNIHIWYLQTAWGQEVKLRPYNSSHVDVMFASQWLSLWLSLTQHCPPYPKGFKRWIIGLRGGGLSVPFRTGDFASVKVTSLFIKVTWWRCNLVTDQKPLSFISAYVQETTILICLVADPTLPNHQNMLSQLTTLVPVLQGPHNYHEWALQGKGDQTLFIPCSYSTQVPILIYLAAMSMTS